MFMLSRAAGNLCGQARCAVCNTKVTLIRVCTMAKNTLQITDNARELLNNITFLPIDTSIS